MTNQSLYLSKPPIMATQMIIRKPINQVFEAFVDPRITTKIWFTKSSGKLEPHARVTWEWEMYNVSSKVIVKEFEQDKRIVVEWNEDNPTTIEWRFSPYQNDATFVIIKESGYKGTGDDMVAQAIGSMGGFSFLLASAKAFLEHGIALNLVRDHVPQKATE
jgi:uncharacterized protein YndB with AHSA1/START domain